MQDSFKNYINDTTKNIKNIIKNIFGIKSNRIMPIEEKDEIIKQNICNYIPTVKINLRINSVNGYLEVFFVKDEIILPILEDNSWNEIKRNIDRKLKIAEQKLQGSIENENENEIQKKKKQIAKQKKKWGVKQKVKQNDTYECIVCYKHILEYDKNIICLKCTAVWCLDCYIRIKYFDSGVVKCPQCRHNYGNTQHQININSRYVPRINVKKNEKKNENKNNVGDSFSILCYN